MAAIIGTPGEQSGPVYKITIGRPDIDLRAHGAVINARMGLNTWAAFAGTDADAMVAGDVAMLEAEVTPVLKALRARGLDVVAIHHHMTDVKPAVIFLHYFGRGPADKLARGVRAAVDLLGKPVRTAKNVLFMCPHGAAKSVLAAAYFDKQARERGLDVHVRTVGTEPDPAVSPAVAAHLRANGYDVPVAKPQLGPRKTSRPPIWWCRSAATSPAVPCGARCGGGMSRVHPPILRGRTRRSKSTSSGSWTSWPDRDSTTVAIRDSVVI